MLLSLSCTSLSCCFLRALACKSRPRSSASKATCAAEMAAMNANLLEHSTNNLQYLPYHLCCLQVAVLAKPSSLCCPSSRLQGLLDFADMSICSHLQQRFLGCICEARMKIWICAAVISRAPNSSASRVRKESAGWEASGRVPAGSVVMLQTVGLLCARLKGVNSAWPKSLCVCS